MLPSSSSHANGTGKYSSDPIRVPLVGGGFTLVDAEDVERMQAHTWKAFRLWAGAYTYAGAHVMTADGPRTLYLHRFITDAGKGTHVDHINGYTLDNRKQNLRVCSPRENLINRQALNRNNTTGYRGVLRTKSGRFRAQITVNYERIGLGTFDTAEEAALARDQATIEYFGELGYLNFPEEVSR